MSKSDGQKHWDETADGLARAAEEAIFEHPLKEGYAMNESDFTVEVYRSRRPLGRQQWRWRVLSTHNGKLVATGGEAYTNRTECEEMARRLFGGRVQ